MAKAFRKCLSQAAPGGEISRIIAIAAFTLFFVSLLLLVLSVTAGNVVGVGWFLGGILVSNILAVIALVRKKNENSHRFAKAVLITTGLCVAILFLMFGIYASSNVQ